MKLDEKTLIRAEQFLRDPAHNCWMWPDEITALIVAARRGMGADAEVAAETERCAAVAKSFATPAFRDPMVIAMAIRAKGEGSGAV